jgi:hypothetical protein
MMLHFRIHLAGQLESFEHSGALDFGRAEARDGVPRCVLEDPWVSRHHLRVVDLPSGKVELTNLSPTNPVRLPDGVLAGGETRRLDVPVLAEIGRTLLEIVPYVARRKPESVLAPAGAPEHRPGTSGVALRCRRLLGAAGWWALALTARVFRRPRCAPTGKRLFLQFRGEV